MLQGLLAVLLRSVNLLGLLHCSTVLSLLVLVDVRSKFGVIDVHGGTWWDTALSSVMGCTSCSQGILRTLLQDFFLKAAPAVRAACSV